MDVYQVFHSPAGAQGNLAAIAFTGEGSAGEKTASLEGADDELPADLTRCYIKRSGTARFLVDCYQRGHRIHCCGHGLLACAQALFAMDNYPQIELGDGISAERAEPGAASPRIWLHLPSVKTNGIDVPCWTSQLLSTTSFLSAAMTASNDGYLLLQLAESCCLESLIINIDAIGANTERAILVWQRDATDKNRVKTRYFAPQYGNNEDAATGSVLRALGPHLKHHYALETFSVFQCSAAGGSMAVRNTDKGVAISGNVRLMESGRLPTARTPQT